MDINRISGYIPGKIVNFLMQVSCCLGVVFLPAPVGDPCRCVASVVDLTPWPNLMSIGLSVIFGLTRGLDRGRAGVLSCRAPQRMPGRRTWTCGHWGTLLLAPPWLVTRFHGLRTGHTVCSTWIHIGRQGVLQNNSCRYELSSCTIRVAYYTAQELSIHSSKVSSRFTVQSNRCWISMTVFPVEREVCRASVRLHLCRTPYM
jgi:hypothetical protein